MLVLGACIALQAPWADPPPELSDDDLVGIWQIRTGGSTETVKLETGGTFRQEYVEDGGKYEFVSPIGRWSIERLANGQMRVHLIGARYFQEGPEVAELQGRLAECPWESGSPQACLRPFYDPFSKEYIEMPGELVLNVRVDSQGRLLLYQMWTSGDGGFPLLGGGDDYFTLKN
jgi:hypothetical protein